jgi:hypothetical protein
MGQSYKQCTACGARALRIATRCPGCHREFPRSEPAAATAGQARSGRPGSSRAPGLAAGVLVVAAILVLTELGQTGDPTVDSASAAVADTTADPTEVAYTSNGGTVARAPERASASGAPGRPELKVARTWTHVRKAPRRSADLEAVLTPGDTVVADSLQRGWYRVALDGEVLGYAYGSALAATDSGASGSGPTP